MRAIKFTSRYYIPFIISSVLIIGGFVATFTLHKGFNLGIDFSGGVELSVAVPNSVTSDRLSQVIFKNLGYKASIRSFKSGALPAGQSSFYVRLPSVKGKSEQDISEATEVLLQKSFKGTRILATERISGSFASVLGTQTSIALILAVVIILIYVWLRFRISYSVSSIAALVHDLLFTVAFVGAFSIEFSTTVIAALLTILGYSLNDTIVIFDRVRENLRSPQSDEFDVEPSFVKDTVDLSITQSLSRTLITSLTTLIVVVIIFILTTGVVKDFALVMIVGVIVGTYSSNFIASPLLLMFQKAHRRHLLRARSERRQKQIEIAEHLSSKTTTNQVKNITYFPGEQLSAEQIAEKTVEKRQKVADKKKKKRRKR